MADEPRRSGRATKGQHTKDREASEEATTARKGRKGKASKKAAQEQDQDEEEDAYIRCICGQYEEEEETERSMICCDNCEAWQHNDCMGLPDDPTYLPESYYCEQCKPENHKELLAKMERGEKPWEEAARRREAAAAAAGKPKKGKRGRKSAASRVSQDVEEGVAARSGQKRKVEDEASIPEAKGPKKARSNVAAQNGRKSTSTQPEYDPTPVAGTVAELNNATRKTVANQLVKAFVEHTQHAVTQGAFALPRGTSTEQSGTHLGLLIEHAMYAVHCNGSGEPNEAYKSQMRTILYNVKKNTKLRDRIVNGEISAQRLASMDAQEMASDEQQKKDAALKRELEKQHTIVQEQGPRIRRTHKGEEYVDEAHQVAAESTKSRALVRQGPMDGEETRSPEAMSPQEPVQTPRPASSHRPRPSVDTKRKSSTNFDIDNVWSTVQGSPDANHQRFPELQPQSPQTREPADPGAGADADIDALLKDEDIESPPYSPKDYDVADGVVWRGVVNGGALGRFHCAAKYAAGCSVESLHMTYHDLIPVEIGISGRIDPTKADDYLCGLQYSQSSDVIVVSIPEPTEPAEANQFMKLFQYFKSRNRYGVGTQHRNPAIKDIYLIPLDVGDSLPGLLDLLENKFSNPVQQRMFMLPFVIKNTELTQNAATQGAPPTPVQHTPVTPFEGAQGPHDFSQHAPALPYHQPSNGTPAPGGMPYQQHPGQAPPYPSQTVIVAQQILGPDLARAPAVLQLIAQGLTAGPDEMEMVKACIQQDPRAAQDISILTGLLSRRFKETETQRAPQQVPQNQTGATAAPGSTMPHPVRET